MYNDWLVFLSSNAHVCVYMCIHKCMMLKRIKTLPLSKGGNLKNKKEIMVFDHYMPTLTLQLCPFRYQSTGHMV
jgi:hypothetical protein